LHRLRAGQRVTLRKFQFLILKNYEGFSMAAPDIQNLFERILQIYGGQSGSTEPVRSERRYQSSQPAYSAPGDAYGSEDGYPGSQEEVDAMAKQLGLTRRVIYDP
jgi:hypothetical protein